MRRMPFLKIGNDGLEFVCPNCKTVISRSMYLVNKKCPYCNTELNRGAKALRKFYDILDKELNRRI